MEPTKQKMDKARRQRKLIKQGRPARVAYRREPNPSPPQPGNKRFFTLQGNNIAFLFVLIVTTATLIFAWRYVTNTDADLQNQRAAVSLTKPAASEPVDTARIDASAERLVTVIADLNKRVTMLTESITYLESKLIRAHVITDSIIATEHRLTLSPPEERPLVAEATQIAETLPPPAAGRARPSKAVTESIAAFPASTTLAPESTAQRQDLDDTDKATAPGGGGWLESEPSTEEASSMSATPAAQDEVGKEFEVAALEAPTAAGHGIEGDSSIPHGRANAGAWVINLTSSPSKAHADRFMARARSLGIKTEQQHATVKGKEYWRVRIPGFSTLADAQAYAVTAKERLGLDEVWFARR